jgi:hypothetical protein
MIAGGAERLGKVLSKKSQQAMVGLTNATGRDMNKMLSFAAGPGAKGLGKVKVADDVLADTADLISKRRWDLEGNIERDGEEITKVWREISDAADSRFGKRPGAEIVKELFTPEDMAQLVDKYGDSATAAAAQIEKSVGKAKGAENIREGLWRQIKGGRLNPDADVGGATADMAKIIRERFDDAALESFAGAGGKLPDYAPDMGQFKKLYRVVEPLATAEARASVKPLRVNFGSNTAPKLLASAALGAATGAGTGEDTEAKIRNAIAGTVIGGLGQAALGRLGGRGIAAASELLKGAPELGASIGKMAPQIASVTGKLAANAASPAQRELFAPEDQGRAMGGPGSVDQAAATGADAGQAIASGDAQGYQDIVVQKLTDLWNMSGGETQFPGGKDEFIAAMYSASGGFKPENTAGLLYPDPEEREKFLQALKFNAEIAQSLPEAGETGGGFLGTTLGVPGSEIEGRTAAKSKLMGDIASGIASSNGVTSSEIKKSIGKVLNSRDSIDKKRARINNILANYGIDLNMLTKWGLA